MPGRELVGRGEERERGGIICNYRKYYLIKVIYMHVKQTEAP